MIIRTASKEDFDGVFDLLLQLWPDKGMVKERYLELFDRTLDSDNGFVFCAFDGKLRGVIIGSVMNNYYSCGDACYVSALVVDSEARGMHIGTDLLDTLKEYATRRGCVAIELDSNLYRERAHSFYVRYGFNKRAFTFTFTL